MRETRPGLFIDRDGTLIELVDYLADPGKVTLLTDTVSEVRRANSAGIAVVIVTNQSGIGRGLYQWADFEAVQARVIELLLEAGAKIDAVYACPHPPPDAGGPFVSAYRKPAPGMLMRASRTSASIWRRAALLATASPISRRGKLQGYLWAFLLEPAIVSEMQRRLKCSLMKSSRLISFSHYLLRLFLKFRNDQNISS